MDPMTELQSKWLEGSGPFSDLVISSRVRLARNLVGISYPHLMSKEKAVEILENIRNVISKPQFAADNLDFLVINELPPLQRQLLVDKHIISPQLATGSRPRAVIIGNEQAISIMVNEEDHLRIQVLLPALQLHECWRGASRVDDLLEEHLNYAFDGLKGYLTACPTNVGTGLRASVMLHLPGLIITGQARRVLTALSQIGLAVRGLYGEGTEAEGNLFQVSNQVTLGQSEEEIINNLSIVTKQLIDQEHHAREALLKQAKTQLEDRVWRAYALLKYARTMDKGEALRLLSEVRLGVDMGLIGQLEVRRLTQLIIMLQPAFIQGTFQREMDAQEQNKARAQVLRDWFNQKSI